MLNDLSSLIDFLSEFDEELHYKIFIIFKISNAAGKIMWKILSGAPRQPPTP